MNTTDTEKKISAALSAVIEPDLNQSIITLDLVTIEEKPDNTVIVKVHMHNPAMHARKKMEEQCTNAIKNSMPELSVQVETIPLPPENKRPAHLRTMLKGVKHIVAIASGKGGVGKSTVTANLAVTLKQMGFKVGVLDADIYGPSMPVMFGVEGKRPALENRAEGQILIPVESDGIKILSIGFFCGYKPGCGMARTHGG